MGVVLFFGFRRILKDTKKPTPLFVCTRSSIQPNNSWISTLDSGEQSAASAAPPLSLPLVPQSLGLHAASCMPCMLSWGAVEPCGFTFGVAFIVS